MWKIPSNSAEEISLTPQKIQSFQDKILNRYEENKRDLPWRDSFDSYKILLSEVMAQQTQVDRVIPKYYAFLKEADSFEELAELQRKDLLRLWSWLGFNSRAIRLQETARIILEKFWWILPKNREELLSLPWIWSYSSASLLAFAYNIEAPVIDTNIRRVFIYELGISERTAQKKLESIALLVTPLWKANDWNNALMDYGSLEATAKKTWIKSLGKQSKFEWSKRQVRGNILKWLVKHWKTDVSLLRARFEHESFDSILEWMLSEWIVSWNVNQIEL